MLNRNVMKTDNGFTRQEDIRSKGEPTVGSLGSLPFTDFLAKALQKNPSFSLETCGDHG